MKFIFVIVLVAVLAGCKKGSPPPPILQPVVGVACDVETSLMNSFGNSIANACGGNAVACGPALQVAFSNINICNMEIPQPSSAMMVAHPKWAAAMAAHPDWKKISDIPSSALGGAQGAQIKAMVQQMGIIGTLVCPVAIGAGMGFLSASIPPACACTQSLSASAIDQAFVLGCESLMAPLP